MAWLSSGWLPAQPAQCAEVLVPRASKHWRYFDRLAQRVERWSRIDFDDQSWPRGQAPLGYGDSDVKTELCFGSNRQRKNPAVFFRHRFRVADADVFQKLYGQLICDDGAVVYVNDKEVYRLNMPEGTVTTTTHALRAIGPDAEQERATHAFVIDSTVVRPGENVVAISVHQANPTSSDLALEFELVGLESDEEVLQVSNQRFAEESNARSKMSASLPVIRFHVGKD